MSAVNQPTKEAEKVGQYFDARGRREIGDQRPTVNLYLPHQQGTSPYWLLEVEDAERLAVALLEEAGIARKAATLLRKPAQTQGHPGPDWPNSYGDTNETITPHRQVAE